MQDFSFETWLILAVVGGFTVTSILLTLAHQLGQEREIHDLKKEVQRLREAYRRRLAEGAGAEGALPDNGEILTVDVVEESPSTSRLAA